MAERIKKLFDEAEIAARVEHLARDIQDELGPEFTLVGVLKGSFVFLADLVRALDRAGARPKVEMMQLSSYGKAMESRGKVDQVGDLPRNLADQKILLVDDIVDTGLSMVRGQELLSSCAPAQMWTCALLDKPSRRETPLVADFVGFEIPDVFVVGYGIDYAERFRHLPFIGTIY